MHRYHGDPPPALVYIGSAASIGLFLLVGVGNIIAILITGQPDFPYWDKIIAASLLGFVFFTIILGWSWPNFSQMHKHFSNPVPPEPPKSDQANKRTLDN